MNPSSPRLRGTLYRIPEEGMISGVCAGIAHYLGLPPVVIRLLVVILSLSGFFLITIIAYFILSNTLEKVPAYYADKDNRYGGLDEQSANQVINRLRNSLQASEMRLRQLERYITSDTYNLEKRFKDL